MPTHLITGGAGFIGSHLAEYLLAQGNHVWVIDNLSTGRISNIAHLEQNPLFRCFIDDIRNEHLMEGLIREADYIYHLSASVGVRMIIERPTETIINNVMGTEIVLRTLAGTGSRSSSLLHRRFTARVYNRRSEKMMIASWGQPPSRAGAMRNQRLSTNFWRSRTFLKNVFLWPLSASSIPLGRDRPAAMAWLFQHSYAKHCSTSPLVSSGMERRRGVLLTCWMLFQTWQR